MHYFPAFSLTLSFNESKRFSGNEHLKKTSRVKWIEENRCFSNNYLSFICLFNFLPLHFSGTHVRTVHTGNYALRFLAEFENLCSEV